MTGVLSWRGSWAQRTINSETGTRFNQPCTGWTGSGKTAKTCAGETSYSHSNNEDSSEGYATFKGFQIFGRTGLTCLGRCADRSTGIKLIGTRIAIGIPQGTYARIAPQSGLVYKESIGIGCGVIDASYTGEVKVIIKNYGKKDYQVQEGDRIAQMIIEN